MKFLTALTTSVFLAGAALAGDVEIAGMKSKAPEGWKEEPPANEMRLTQFKLPKAEGDPEDAQLIIFKFAGGSGTAEQNLQRQRAKFKPAEGKDKVEEKLDKVQVGKIEAPYQDLSGTFLSKFPPNAPTAKVTEKANYRQLYVILVTDKGDFYPTLVGPAKTVEKHKKEFEEFLKNFK
ncbi:MAG TPA: hypothetical protein VKE40_08185 [Gemmataceae bacterium]|nr:hypothetical protein [Gemmataceae bacterium]